MCDPNRIIRYTGLVLFLVLMGCAPITPVLSEPVDTAESKIEIPGLTALEITALSSLIKVNDYPLYTMHTTVDYRASGTVLSLTAYIRERTTPWACSLFAALGDKDNVLYGRNFDWEHSPALLLFSNPPDGFTSVAMVDLAFFVPEEKVDRLTEIPLEQRVELLDAPFWPIDGMNEYGLTVGMAAVPDSQVPIQPGREWIGSLGIIREMLDNSRDVKEAIDVAKSYNISFEGGPNIHYLVADALGKAVLIELYEGELYLHPNNNPWHTATNFTLAAVNGAPDGRCTRYDALAQQLVKAQGKMTVDSAVDLLSNVAQQNTQWSVVYEASTHTVNIAMGRHFKNIQTFTISD